MAGKKRAALKVASKKLAKRLKTPAVITVDDDNGRESKAALDNNEEGSSKESKV